MKNSTREKLTAIVGDELAKKLYEESDVLFKEGGRTIVETLTTIVKERLNSAKGQVGHLGDEQGAEVMHLLYHHYTRAAAYVAVSSGATIAFANHMRTSEFIHMAATLYEEEALEVIEVIAGMVGERARHSIFENISEAAKQTTGPDN